MNTPHDKSDKRRRNIVIIVFVLVTLFLVLSQIVLSTDQWDRPLVIFNVTPFVINFTNNLNYLEQKIDNETIQRISNDTYIQSQINESKINITQLFNITTIYGINISQLFNITSNLNNDINNIENDIIDIYIDIDTLYNITDIHTQNISYLIGLVDNLTILTQTINQSITNLNNSINQINQSIKQPYGEYLSWNSSNFWINETSLNTTINNISKNRQNLYISTINVSSGSGFIQTTNIEYLLTKITINGFNNFRSECIESTSGSIIDKDRQVHHYIWDIEKNYAINDKINCSITSATDGIYNITITYVTNGLQ